MAITTTKNGCSRSLGLDDGRMNKLNLNYLKWSNKSYGIGKHELLRVSSPSKINIDYLALYSKPGEYFKTLNTALCFYEYDTKIDGRNGLWCALYYNDQKLLDKYKRRFTNIKVAIAPDYSLCGDTFEDFNAINIQRARIVSIWLACECNILVIPNVTYSNEESFEYMLDGLEDCRTVAFSIKGSMRKLTQKYLLEKAIKITVDRLKFLKNIVVYSVCTSDEETKRIFEYATSKGICVTIPDNLLKSRNAILEGIKNG